MSIQTPNSIQTPIQSSLRKRALSSPEFIAELKKHCKQLKYPSSSSSESDISDIAEMSAPVSSPTGTSTVMEPECKIVLSEADISHIADVLQSTFQEKIADMVKSITDGVVKSIETQLNKLQSENQALKHENIDLKARVASLELSQDSAEQYSRRNNIRISGIAESADESTDNVVLDLAKAINANISLDDIDRSHRVGKLDAGKKRDIIVKFATYRSRYKLMSQRKLIKVTEVEAFKRVFLNDDLTRSRSKLLFEARCVFKSGKIQGAWSSDGSILIKDHRNQIRRVTCTDDLLSLP